MTNVFSTKPANGTVIRLGLTKALLGSAFGGYVADRAAGIAATRIMVEYVIERVSCAQRGLEFFAGAQRRQFASLHDRDTITMAFRLLQVVRREEQSRAVV